MDYEKKYKEALERAKILYNDKNEIGYANAESVLEEVFPLLKESEDERIKKTLINFFSKGAEYDSSTNGIKDRNIIAWLEKQGEQKPQRMISAEAKEAMYDKPAWNEKDEKEYKYVLKFVDNILNNCGNKKDYEHCKRCYDWLKSLKDRYTWKPSDKQMKFLQKCIEAYNEVTFPTEVRVLSSLYNDLKKLKGEKL